jgi:hypothetical protein
MAEIWQRIQKKAALVGLVTFPSQNRPPNTTPNEK